MKRKKRKKKMGKFLFSLCIIAVCVGIIYLAADFIGHKNDNVKVHIPIGSSAKQIAQILHEKEVIRCPLAFRLFIKNDIANLKCGIHDMTKSMGYVNALSELKNYAQDEGIVRVVIPEGSEFREIAKLLDKAEVVTEKEFYDAAENKKFDYDFLSDAGKSDIKLEGYLFPATYDFYKGTSAETVIKTMLDKFDEMLTDEYRNKILEKGLSIHEAVTMASIVEKEAAKDTDRPKIASVFYNRLKSSYPYLESCASVQYVLKERKDVLSDKDTEIKSPYNTYRNKGLPPGPIASPGEASIKAVLYPANTNYLYFVADGKGGHVFSTTFGEHLNAQVR